MIRAHWLKPYSRIEEGMMLNSIIAYAKRPYKQEYLLETESVDGKNYPTITQWSYYLMIDLWFLKLQVQWVGKEALPNDSKPRKAEAHDAQS